jgi:hypothetical protein
MIFRKVALLHAQSAGAEPLTPRPDDLVLASAVQRICRIVRGLLAGLFAGLHNPEAMRERMASATTLARFAPTNRLAFSTVAKRPRRNKLVISDKRHKPEAPAKGRVFLRWRFRLVS